MSGLERPEVPTTRALKRKHFSDNDQFELDELDRIFKRTKAVVPPAPYILSTPSMDPYRYHSQQEANAWMMGRLWRYDEEHLQYRTYLFREPCLDCFELQAGEDDEPEPGPERPKSQASSTASQAPKKKITLSAYKSGKASGIITPVPDSKKPSPSLPPTKPPSSQTNGISKPEKLSGSAETAPHKSQKRPPVEQRDERKSDKDNLDSHRSEQSSRPRASSSLKTESNESKNIIDKSSPSNSTPHGLPPLLSPVHEPLSNPYGLPSILSPTLPSAIQIELDKLKEHPARPESSASVSSSEPKNQTVPATNPRPHIAEKSVKKEPRIRTVSVNGKPPDVAPANPADDTDPSLVVKLKYPKAKATTIKSLLKLPPKRSNPEKKERLEAPKESPVKVHTKPVEGTATKAPKPTPKIVQRRPDTSTPTSTAKLASASTKTAEKRPRADDDASLAVPAKRPRASSTNDRQVTPTPRATTSPAPPGKLSAQKAQAQYVTPKKDHKSVSMLRTASTDSHDTTPGRSGTTPAGRADSKAATSAPMTAKKSADISLLAQTSMRLNQMGRSLKHEATKILTSNKITKQDEKRAAVINLECILSYMAAYHAQDLSLTLRGRACEVEQTWKTLLPLCLSYARCTKPFSHLDGLREYLGSIIASTICTCVSQRAAPPATTTGKPADSPHDLPPTDLAKHHAFLADNFALLADHTRKTAQHYADARATLPLETIQHGYPKTYAARESIRDVEKEKERHATRLSGSYALPLASDSSAIQGVRFGLRFLEEYCDKEGVQYRVRLNLDRSD